MITSLSKLTMRQYIELVCGDTSVLTPHHEIASKSKLQETRKRLIYEYSQLSDSAGVKTMLSEYNGKYKAKMELMLFQIMTNMLAMSAYDDVRKHLRDYGIARPLDDDQLRAEIERLLKRAKTNIKKAEKEQEKDDHEPSADEIRSRFDKQAASLMTYFKFQIDLTTIPASQFACMLDQAQKEIKAKMAAMKRK